MRLSPASVVHFSASVRYFLCLIFMGTNILLDEIPSSFVLDLLQTSAASTIKGVCEVRVCQFVNKLEAVAMIVLGSFKYTLPY